MTKYIGLDVGGSHVFAALMKIENKNITIESVEDISIDSNATSTEIIDQLANVIKYLSFDIKRNALEGIGVSIPGPFDYQKGVSRITGLNKYETLFGVNLKESLLSFLKDFDITSKDISFINDAKAFLLGIVETHNLNKKNITALTIGTGFGSASLWNSELMDGYPDKGSLYKDKFSGIIADELFSTRWFLNQIDKINISKRRIKGVKELSNLSQEEKQIQKIFDKFGENLAVYLNQLFALKQPDLLFVGGNIVKSQHLFREHFIKNFSHAIPIMWIEQTTEHAAIGALRQHLRSIKMRVGTKKNRQSVSPTLPVHKYNTPDGYDIYPTSPLVNGNIKIGFDTFVNFLKKLKSNKIILDGNSGIHWGDLISSIRNALSEVNIFAVFYDASAALKSEADIDNILKPYLGGEDPVFGKLYGGELIDFFNSNKLKKIRPSSESFNILYGTGAALLEWEAPLIYFDLPKNEIQYRSKAGSIQNLGKSSSEDPKKMYKRFYFVEWPICDRHKQKLLPNLVAIVDTQRENTITWAEGEDIRKSLTEISKSPFRVRPWFEPGVWGGKWMQQHIKGLNPKAENFAWSFELIAPENGLILQSGKNLLEIGFEWLMYQSNQKILGCDSETYGAYFPLRFDYLDTMKGENLSLQCHPKLSYIKEKFGEKITQDETYFIMETKPHAKVYLGFKEGVKLKQFESDLKKSQVKEIKFDVNKYVQSFLTRRHNLYLIPAGTIHCSGKDNLVLEISNTPYIYTFKMYDWRRVGLDGKPRPININRAIKNLDFTIQGERIEEEFISTPQEIYSDSNGRVLDLQTHKSHLYKVHLIEVFDSSTFHTKNKFHILNLVEGDFSDICTNDMNKRIHYAETIIIPASVGEYKIVNKMKEPVKILRAFMK